MTGATPEGLTVAGKMLKAPGSGIYAQKSKDF